MSEGEERREGGRGRSRCGTAYAVRVARLCPSVEGQADGADPGRRRVVGAHVKSGFPRVIWICAHTHGVDVAMARADEQHEKHA